MTFARIGASALMIGLLAAPAAFAQSSDNQQAYGQQSAYDQLSGQNRQNFDNWFGYFDNDHNGTITEQEYAQSQNQRFRAADGDGNGQLSKNEVLSYFQQEGGNASAASSSSSSYGYGQ